MKKIIAILLVIILCLSVCACGDNANTETSNNYITAGRDGMLFSTDAGEFYMSSCKLISTNNHKDLYPFEFLFMDNDEEDSDTIQTYHRCVIVGNTMYAQISDDLRIYKIDLIDTNYGKGEIWFDINDAQALPAYALHCSSDWQYSNGYIYFLIQRDLEYASNMSDSLYRLIRINVNTKKAEIVDESISTTAYVIYGDQLYYYENGFVRGLDNVNTYDGSKAGIYRMNLKDKSKERIMAHPSSSFTDFSYLETASDAYSRLSIYKDRIYFIDNTDPYNSIICSINLDGSNLKKISDNATYEYTINAESDKLYYVTGSYYRTIDEVKELYEVSLADFSNTKIAKYYINGERMYLGTHKNKISLNLLSEIDQEEGTKEDPYAFGFLIDVNTHKVDTLYNYCTTSTESMDTGRGGVLDLLVIDSYNYSWQENTSDKLIMY